jgi:hypothetical protein
MTKLTLLGAAAVLATVIATPVMAQEATQEPGAIGYNYPNADYLTGGWGVHTPPGWTGRWPRVGYGYVAAPYAYGPAYGYGYRYRYGYAPGVVVAPVYDAYGYAPY